MKYLHKGILLTVILALFVWSTPAADGPDALEKLIFKTNRAKITATNDGSVTFLSDSGVSGSATASLRAAYSGKVLLEATCAPPPGIENPNFTFGLGTKGKWVGGGVQLGQGRAWIRESGAPIDLVSKEGAPYIGPNEFTVKLELDLQNKKARFFINDFRVESTFNQELAEVDEITVSSYVQGIVVKEIVLSADTIKRIPKGTISK